MKLPLFLAALAASTAATSADAALLQFTITGDYNASFLIDESPTPDFVLDGWMFAVVGVAGFPNATTGTLGDITFFNKDFGGGILVSDTGGGFDYLFDASDLDQYYTGPESAPTFRLGTYTLDGLTTRGSFTLTIAQAAAVPEPASWALMIGGFALAGAAMRRRQGARVTYQMA